MSRRLALSVCLSVFVGCAGRPAPEPPPEAPPAPPAPPGKVTVEVRFSVARFDPKRPEGVVECVVTNGTADDVRVPTNYAVWGFDSDVVLFGRPVAKEWFARPMRLVGRGEGERLPPYAVLPPGGRRVVFAEALRGLLADAKSDRWVWEA